MTVFCPSKHCREKPSRNHSKNLFSILLALISTNTLEFLFIFTSSVLCLWYVKFCCLPGTHQLISHFRPSNRHREKIRWNSLWAKVKTGGSLTHYWHQQNRQNSRKMDLISAKNRIWRWETKTNRNHLPWTLLSSEAELHCHSQLFYLLFQCRGRGSWSPASLHIHSFVLFLPSAPFPCSTMGPPHRIECGTDGSSVGPSLPTAPARKIAHCWAPHGCSFLQGMSTCRGRGYPWVDVFSSLFLHMLQRKLCLARVALPLISFLTLEPAGYPPHFFQFFLSAAAQHFSPFLRDVSTETPPACLKASALGKGGLISEPDGRRSLWHRGHPHGISPIPTAKVFHWTKHSSSLCCPTARNQTDSLTRGE